FGDLSPLNTTQSPSHLYANAGNYSVTLMVHNNFGCGDTITKSVQVYYNPVAGFTYSNVCLGDTMYFTNTSAVDNSTSIATYLWAFGDGSPNSSLPNPVHYYSGPGTYNTTLVTTTTDVCSHVANNSVKAFDAPGSTFTFSDICLLDSAIFTNTTTSPTMGSTASWSWNFGDGSPLNTTLWSLRHLYATPGNYQVTLTTYSSNLACPDTLSDSITVFPMPGANFSFTNVCLNQAMNFNDLSTVSSGSIAIKSWDFGDGTSPNGNPNPSHIYVNPGTY
ncbi:MAG: PKD domain-containing protein, partial [Bacteroidota bacterium]